RIATGVGERRHQRLADGAELTLNAESALDVLFSDRQRLLSLAQGDAFVQTAGPAVAGDAGPLRVDTAHGSIRALGTRFM
ncbi:FecR domain-containing protein, partial [Acinetobacter baumannii]